MKTLALVALVCLTLPISVFAQNGVSAKMLSSILSAPAVTKVMKNRSIDKVAIEPLAAMESSGFLVRIQVTEVGLSPGGPSTHPCYISIEASRAKGATSGPYAISANEICAMSAPARTR